MTGIDEAKARSKRSQRLPADIAIGFRCALPPPQTHPSVPLLRTPARDDPPGGYFMLRAPIKLPLVRKFGSERTVRILRQMRLCAWSASEPKADIETPARVIFSIFAHRSF